MQSELLRHDSEQFHYGRKHSRHRDDRTDVPADETRFQLGEVSLRDYGQLFEVSSYRSNIRLGREPFLRGGAEYGRRCCPCFVVVDAGGAEGIIDLDYDKAHGSVLPEVLEPGGADLGITYRVLNPLVPEVVLDSARILATVGKVKTARVPQHVRMDRELDAGRFASVHHHAMNRPRFDRDAAA